MDNQWQRALADVVRAELALRGKSAKDAYTALGISSTAWQTYFKSQSRDIPSRVLIDIAAYLRMPLSALIAKAEAREVELAAELDGPAPDLSEHITRQLSPAAQAQVRAARTQMAERSAEGQPNV